MDLLIKAVRVIDCSQDFYGDVYIGEGKIKEIGVNLIKECKVIDGEGLLLLPSFIDLHVHFRDPGFTYKECIETGSLAAARGGYTAVNLMANTKPVCSSMEIVEYVLKKVQRVGLVDAHQCISITNNFDGEDISHLDKVKNPVRFISDDGKGVKSDRVMLSAMEKAKSLGITVISHAEVPDITDARLTENLMTVRDLTLAEYTGCHLHMAHVSTKEAMDAVIQAKRRGVNVTCEVTPHHIADIANKEYRVNPPIRNREDIDILIKAIKDGWIDTISTDHAPHSPDDKLNGAPGISGIETSFSVCYTTLVEGGHISINKLSEIMSRNPGRIMGHNKGEIKPGYDGDVVLIDTGKKHIISAERFASKGKNTPFEGMKFSGAVVMTIKGGRIVYDGREE